MAIPKGSKGEAVSGSLPSDLLGDPGFALSAESLVV